jgi:uncharacterized protein
MSDNQIWHIISNRPLVAAVAAMASSQIFKTLRPVIAGKRPRIRDVFNYGGWPSSHTAFIVSCAAAVGLTEGFDSSLFAVAVTVGCILVYDILKMRKVVALGQRETDRLLEKSSMARAEVPPQFAAHSPWEILGGVLWGGAWAAVVCALFPS